MARHTDLVKVSVQLIDDGRHLLRQVAGVHCVLLPAAWLRSQNNMRQLAKRGMFMRRFYVCCLSRSADVKRASREVRFGNRCRNVCISITGS